MDLYVETEKVRHIIVLGGRGQDRQVVELVGSATGRLSVGRWKWE